MSEEVVVILVDIIQTELGLADGQVMIENQRWPIPNASGLYIFLRSISPRPIASKTWLEDQPGGGAAEVQQVSMVDLIQIDVMSADQTARQRAPEIVMALRSLYSERKQEQNNFQIARIPQSFQNAGELEGATRMNRFTATVAVAWLATKKKADAEYYDKITTPEVVTNA